MQIGIHLDSGPAGQIADVERIERLIGEVAIVGWFQAWGGGYRDVSESWLDAVARSGRAGLITWEPWALSGEAHQPAYAPARIAAGDHDAYIDAWARAFAQRSDGPWYLRPMHEMNGDWYPWGAGVDDVTPADLRAAWRHIHDRFSAAGATALRWVWCPLADDVVGPFEDYYPGPDYVDVLALDGYNWGAEVPEYGGWRTHREVFAPAYDRLCRLGSQPVWLAEVGCAPEGGDKAAWIEQLLADPALSTRLEAVVFFTLDKERDWRIDADPRVVGALRGHHHRSSDR